jgi:hypothetical protein
VYFDTTLVKQTNNNGNATEGEGEGRKTHDFVFVDVVVSVLLVYFLVMMMKNEVVVANIPSLSTCRRIFFFIAWRCSAGAFFMDVGRRRLRRMKGQWTTEW